MSSAAPAIGVEAFRTSVSHKLASIEIAAPDTSVVVDGIFPDAVITPGDEGELSLALREAAANGLAVIAVGGGRHLGIGNVPDAYDVAISTRRLCGTLDHEPDDVTVTVDAGVTLGALQHALGERGQRLPIDPPCSSDATVGGLLAVNASGPLRHAYGTLRDWVIGMRVAHRDGSVTKSGGRVVKNVSGYDMHKLHIGALGSLGIITQATFKLAPLPHAVASARFGAQSPQQACSLVLRARDAGLAIEAAEMLSPPAAHAVAAEGRWCALLRLAGSSAAVERSLRDLRVIASGLDGALDIDGASEDWPRWYATFAAAPLSLRISVLPSDVAAAVEALDRRLAGAQATVSATVCAGLIRVNCKGDTVDPRTLIDGAREATARNNGFMLVDSAPPEVKATLDVFGEPRSDFAIMRRLKQQFDPHRTLSRGRFVGRL